MPCLTGRVPSPCTSAAPTPGRDSRDRGARPDEASAYDFARRRMVAAFLAPSPDGSDEGAPRPLRAIVPGLAAALVLLAAFAVWGLIRPAAPPGWDRPGAKVLVGSESTTR